MTTGSPSIQLEDIIHEQNRRTISRGGLLYVTAAMCSSSIVLVCGFSCTAIGLRNSGPFVSFLVQSIHLIPKGLRSMLSNASHERTESLGEVQLFLPCRPHPYDSSSGPVYWTKILLVWCPDLCQVVFTRVVHVRTDSNFNRTDRNTMRLPYMFRNHLKDGGHQVRRTPLCEFVMLLRDPRAPLNRRQPTDASLVHC